MLMMLRAGGGNIIMRRLLQETKLLWILRGLKDKSLSDLDNLPDPDVLAKEIAENLESALRSFREVIRQLKRVIKP
jgi:hypothetical protein